MKISVVQPDIIWENIEKNLSEIGRLLKPLYHKTDLVILPEMFSTGFTMNAAVLAEESFSCTYLWMRKMAEDGDFGICGSYIIKEDGNYFNRWIFVSADLSFSYDKRHLFRMGNEDSFYTSGNKQLVFEFRGVRIMPSVCYDLRFPVWTRNRGDYDLLINSANWPAVRRNVWSTLLKARAIENQCYVAGSNRIGTDAGNINYTGDSLIIDPNGLVIAQGEDNKECIINGEINIDDLVRFRNTFPVLGDADNFQIIL